jgi:hypothetical protein
VPSDLVPLAGLSLIVGMTLALLIGRAWASRRPILRSLAGYRVLPVQQSRAIETGQGLHLSLGTGGVGGADTATTLAGLSMLEAMSDEAAATDMFPIVTVADPTTLVMAQDIIRRAYARQGNPAGYDPRFVRYVAAAPLPYAVGAQDILATEDTSANVMLGVFGAEAAFIAEEGSRQGLLQVGGAADPTPLAALYPSTGHVLIGEEMFTAGAYVGNQPSHIASLLAQDIVRWVLAFLILTAALGFALGGVR